MEPSLVSIASGILYPVFGLLLSPVIAKALRLRRLQL